MLLWVESSRVHVSSGSCTRMMMISPVERSSIRLMPITASKREPSAKKIKKTNDVEDEYYRLAITSCHDSLGTAVDCLACAAQNSPSAVPFDQSLSLHESPLHFSTHPRPLAQPPTLIPVAACLSRHPCNCRILVHMSAAALKPAAPDHTSKSLIGYSTAMIEQCHRRDARRNGHRLLRGQSKKHVGTAG